MQHLDKRVWDGVPMISFPKVLKPKPIADSHPDAKGAVAELVGIEVGVVSGVINLESSGVEASDWRPRHDEHYHEV